MWRNRISNRLPAHTIVWLLCCAPAVAQTAVVQLSSPQDILLCGQSIQLAAGAFDRYGVPVSGFAPQWQSSNTSVATVDQNGNVHGVLPGVATIQIADSTSGLSASYQLRVQPLRIDITPAHPTLHVGESVQLSAAAIDANGNPLSGVHFLWNSGLPGTATVAADGTIAAVNTGTVTISAAIDAGSAPLDFSAGVPVSIFRKPDYKLTALISSDSPAGTPTLTMPKMISASGDSLVALIGDLSNGAQGVVLSTNGVPRLLGMSGQTLPGPNKVISRFTGVSVNASGDVVAAVQFPAEWCDSALVLYHQNQPPAVLDTGCNISITDRALANNGDVIYFLENNGNHFYIHHANGSRNLVLQHGDSLPGSLTVASLNRASLTSTGAAILEVYPAGGNQQFWLWKASSFTKLAGVNEPFVSGQITNMDFPVESGTGDLYLRISGNDNQSHVLRYSGGSWGEVVRSSTIIGSKHLWWIFSISAAGADGSIAVLANVESGTGVYRLTAGDPDPLATVSSWSNITQLAGGATGVFGAGLLSGTVAVYKLVSGNAPAPLIAAGWQVPSAGTASLVWDSLPERGSVATPLVRLTGDMFARIAQGKPQPTAAPGALISSDTVLSLGGVATSPDGKNALLSAVTDSGPAFLLAHDGGVDLIGDTNNHHITVTFSQFLTWIDTGGSSPYAMNNNRQFVAMANVGPNSSLWRIDLADTTQSQRIATMQSPSPAGANYNWVNQAAIDASGNAAFIANLSDGSNALFLFANGQVQKLLKTNDTGLGGQKITGLSGIQFAGKAVIVRVNYPTTTVIEAFDGANWSAVVSQGDTLALGRTIDNFVGPNVFANDGGDIAYEARTLGYPSLLVRTHDGRDLMAASSSDPLPDGSWLVFLYGFNLTPQSNLLFVAETYQNGKSHMTLYNALQNN